MPGLDFSMPYNSDPKTLEELLKLQGLGGNRISEIYLSGPQEYSGSGRIMPRTNGDRFLKVIGLIHSNGIRVNLVLNTTCQGADWYSSAKKNSLLSFLKTMHREQGVEAVTIANPIYIGLVKQGLPEIEVCASVLSDVDSVKRAVLVREFGADTITPAADINRRINLLKEIKKATGARIKIMVNEGCLYNCVFRKFHFNFVSHWSKELEHSTMEGKDFFEHCMTVTQKDHSQIFKSGWIRPEDLESYKDITTSFKMVGRARSESLVLRAARAYMSQHYKGNLIDIMCSSLHAFGLTYGAYIDNTALGESGFFSQVTSCDRECHKCSYCQQVAQKLLKLNVVTRGKLEDTGKKELADKLEASGKLPYYG